MQTRADTMLANLRRAGLKLTPQRIAIVREIAEDLTHPTAQALFERLRPAFPTMSFATVYNTLDALVGCGLTGALSTGHGSRAVRFDPNTEPHHHAICDACGTVIDVAVDPASSHAGPLPLPLPVPAPGATAPALSAAPSISGFRILREERIYRGLCDFCAVAGS